LIFDLSPDTTLLFNFH